MSNRRKPHGTAQALPGEDPRLGAAAELLPRLGAKSLELRFSEPEGEGSPLVWIATGFFDGAQPQVAAALSPYRALYRLLEQLVDGGKCTHCKRPTGVSDDLEPLPAEQHICWYVYDPELDTFRRSCEGEPS